MNDPRKITKDFVQDVELEVGMGHVAWDMVAPESLIAAVLAVAQRRAACALSERGVENVITMLRRTTRALTLENISNDDRQKLAAKSMALMKKLGITGNPLR